MRAAHGSAAATLALLFGLLVSLSACNREEPEGAATTETTEVESRVDVTGVTLGRGVGADRRVTEEVGTFRPGDTIYVSIATEGVAPSATLAARWLYEDGQVVDESSQSIAPNGPEVTEFHVTKPDGWPTGNYEVVISLDGREVERKSFSVEAGA